MRTKRSKPISYYSDPLGQQGAREPACEPEWELFGLHRDPHELHSVYTDAVYADAVRELKDELHRLQAEVGDQRYGKDTD